MITQPKGAADQYGDQLDESTPVETLQEWVELAEEASHEARDLAERCRNYYDGKQLTAEELSELQKRGQPEVIRNRIKRKVNFLLGYEAKTRSDPKAWPRNAPDDEDAANAATDMLRFQEQMGHLDQKLSDVWESMVVEGFGGVEVLGPWRKDQRLIEVKRWRYDRLFHDPHSNEHDFSDAEYIGGYVWMDLTRAQQRWPHVAADLTAMCSGENLSPYGDTYDDKPRKFLWHEGAKRKRVRIVSIYYRAGEAWRWCIFSKGVKIEGGVVELTDEMGESVCPMLLASAYVDRENRRYGEVAEFLSPQDEINKRASKTLHLLNSTLTMAEQGAVKSVDELKKQKARPDGHIELTPGALADKRFQFYEHDREIAGHLQLMQDAKSEIDAAGPNAALLGSQAGAPSGRAIRANQEGGLIEIHRLQDRYLDFKRRVYQALWQRCRQFITAETWVRVTDNEDTIRFVGFNRPVTLAEKVVNDARKEGIPDEEIKAWLQSQEANPQAMMALQQVVEMANVPAETDVDIIIEPAAESINMAEETFQTISNLFGPGVLPPAAIVELSPLPAKQKRRIMELLQPPPEAIQEQQMAKGLQADNMAADTEAKRAKAAKDITAANKQAVETLMPVQVNDPGLNQFPAAGG